MSPYLTQAKSPVLPFLWYAPDHAGAPDHPPAWRSRASHPVFEPVCILVKTQQSQYISEYALHSYHMDISWAFV